MYSQKAPFSGPGGRHKRQCGNVRSPGDPISEKHIMQAICLEQMISMIQQIISLNWPNQKVKKISKYFKY